MSCMGRHLTRDSNGVVRCLCDSCITLGLWRSWIELVCTLRHLASPGHPLAVVAAQIANPAPGQPVADGTEVARG